jgi:hypothetical protein
VHGRILLEKVSDNGTRNYVNKIRNAISINASYRDITCHTADIDESEIAEVRPVFARRLEAVVSESASCDCHFVL